MPTWTDPGEVTFDAVLTASGTATGLFVEIPVDTAELFGTRGRVPVTVRVDDVAYRASLVAYGGPHLLAVLRAVRARLGKSAGEPVRVTLRLAPEVSAVPR
ncbi:DUF1905 domain-containing protein [Cellulosimicrobium marinum]|uniref:DUF1905 domain-containing protein n=1 Tax=Cellulosimicrobium marinum TaxID=1638992 RepID=UPI001E585B25|nr:DUF1905 domain-containing protein [Cellulosimicrobium marinum]MCB7137338.1 DUF1905 domain-containing protein [Cellulosimicrobium marinum]